MQSIVHSVMKFYRSNNFDLLLLACKFASAEIECSFEIVIELTEISYNVIYKSVSRFTLGETGEL